MPRCKRLTDIIRHMKHTPTTTQTVVNTANCNSYCLLPDPTLPITGRIVARTAIYDDVCQSFHRPHLPYRITGPNELLGLLFFITCPQTAAILCVYYIEARLQAK